MYVEALMLPNVELVTTTPDEGLKFVLEKMDEKNLISIPVVLGNKFYGVIYRESIYSGYFNHGGDREEYLKNTKVSELLRGDIPTLLPSDDIEKAAHILEIYRIPFAAIINEEGEFLGIITHYTLFKAIKNAIGLNMGRKLNVIVNDVPSQISRLIDMITSLGGNILSFIIMDSDSAIDSKEISLRIRAENYVKIMDSIRSAGFKVQ